MTSREFGSLLPLNRGTTCFLKADAVASTPICDTMGKTLANKSSQSTKSLGYPLHGAYYQSEKGVDVPSESVWAVRALPFAMMLGRSRRHPKSGQKISRSRNSPGPKSNFLNARLDAKTNTRKLTWTHDPRPTHPRHGEPEKHQANQITPHVNSQTPHIPQQNPNNRIMSTNSQVQTGS